MGTHVPILEGSLDEIRCSAVLEYVDNDECEPKHS